MSFVAGIATEWLDFFSYRAAAENERFHSALAERAAVKRTCCLNSRGTSFHTIKETNGLGAKHYVGRKYQFRSPWRGRLATHSIIEFETRESRK
jgi:hypothetical protein